MSENLVSLKFPLFSGPEKIPYTGFFTKGWRRLKGEKTVVNNTLHAKDVEIHPHKKPDDSDLSENEKSQ